MKSLATKKVILKNPNLRNFRKNLRIVLGLAISDKIDRLNKLENLYLQKKRRTPSQWKREIQISLLKNRLLRLRKRSTITCSAPYCYSHKNLFGNPSLREDKRTTDLDLVWIPWYETWVCLDCYNHYYKDTTLNDHIASLGEFFVIFDKNGTIEKDLRHKFRDSFVNE